MRSVVTPRTDPVRSNAVRRRGAPVAAWILRLAKRARRPGPTLRAEGLRRARRHPSARAETMLAVVPDISTAVARSLLAVHGSVAALAAASVADQRRHPGIGPVRAARLVAAHM